MWQRSWSRAAVIGLAAFLFLVCCVLPVAFLSITSFHGAAYSALLLDARQRGLLYNTAVLGAGAALLATAIGVPLGIALARMAMPAKGIVRLTLTAPLLLPPYIVGLAWTYLGGRRGLVAGLTGNEHISAWTYSLPAAVVVLGLVFYPLSLLATEVALRRVDGRLEEAALLVAPPGRVFRRITLPMAAPSILAAALVIFVLAVSEFGVPALLRVRVYTTEVFTAFAALYDFSRAIVLSVPLLLLCVVVAGVAVAVIGERFVATRGSTGTHPPLFDAWRRAADVGMLMVIAGALGLPIVVLARQALGAGSLDAALSGSAAAIANSLTLAAAGAIGVVSIAIWLGYARARARPWIGQPADVLFLALFAIPSTVVGVGLIGVWNRPGIPGLLYGTQAMFLLAYLARFLPVAALILAASTRYVPRSHEEAAAVSGAAWARTMVRIVLPQIRFGIGVAAAVVFILAFGELGASILVSPPGEATLPIRIYTIIANTPPSHVAALALLQTLVVLTPLALLAAVASLRRSPMAGPVSRAVERPGPS